jgi:hypothetical protein
MAKGTPGFFDVDEPLAALSAKGDDLERVKALVDFELFRAQWDADVNMPSSNPVRARFGSWADGLRVAGLPVKTPYYLSFMSPQHDQGSPRKNILCMEVDAY